MYFQEDTILRMIEAMGAFYRKLMGLVNDLEAELELNKAFRQLTGMDRMTAKRLSVEAILDMLPPERCMAMSELIMMEVERFAKQMDQETILDERHRALMLLCGLDDDIIAGKRAERAREIFGLCSEVCSAEDCAKLLRFLRLGGAYADAEDVLFMQLNAFARRQERQLLIAEGEALYVFLLNETDARLANGNLPREEVLEGQAALASFVIAADGGDAT